MVTKTIDKFSDIEPLRVVYRVTIAWRQIGVNSGLIFCGIHARYRVALRLFCSERPLCRLSSSPLSSGDSVHKRIRYDTQVL